MNPEISLMAEEQKVDAQLVRRFQERVQEFFSTVLSDQGPTPSVALCFPFGRLHSFNQFMRVCSKSARSLLAFQRGLLASMSSRACPLL